MPLHWTNDNVLNMMIAETPQGRYFSVCSGDGTAILYFNAIKINTSYAGHAPNMLWGDDHYDELCKQYL